MYLFYYENCYNNLKLDDIHWKESESRKIVINYNVWEVLKLKINNKVFFIASIIFSGLTIISIFFIHSDISFIFLGFSLLFGGLDEINLLKGMDSEETNKGSKTGGIIAIVAGLFIIITYIVRLLS